MGYGEHGLKFQLKQGNGMTDREHGAGEVPPELMQVVFSLFLACLANTIYTIDYVEKRDEITAENFLAHLSRTIEDSQDEMKSYGINHEYLQGFVDLVRKSLLEIDLHNLKNWNPTDEDSG